MSNPITFTDEWEFYPDFVNGISVRLDMGLVSRTDERKRYTHSLMVIIPYETSLENGFPAREELERLNDIEDSFKWDDERLKYIGVVNGRNTCRFVFCADQSVDDLEMAAITIMRQAGPVEYLTHPLPDDAFGIYDNLLLPDLYGKNWIFNRRVCESLLEHGDDLDKPRNIDFFLDFTNPAHLDVISRQLQQAGFQEAGRQDKTGGIRTLHLVLNDTPTLARITELTQELIQLLEDKEGSFEGWGAPVAV